MLCGQSPWGVKRGHIFARLLARSRSFVHQCKVVNAFYWGSGDAIEYCASMLDRTSALGRRIV